MIGFVTNANFLETGTFDGLRQCLAEEFSSIYVFHLRGNARTSGELRRKEKDNIFGIGSRAPIAISLLVKNPNAERHGQIYFHDIGDYLSREDKLAKIGEFGSIAGITAEKGWQLIAPDEHGDWLKQRDIGSRRFIALGDKKSDAVTLFENYSKGIDTSKDAWCYNFSRSGLASNIAESIDFYCSELARYQHASANVSDEDKPQIDHFLNFDSTKISWGRALKGDLVRGRSLTFDPSSLTHALYRPFTKTWMYFNRRMNNMVYQMQRIFPTPDTKNRVICMNGVGAQKAFSTLISDQVPDLHLMQTGQCFPLYLYDVGQDESPPSAPQERLFAEEPHSISKPTHGRSTSPR